jgi:RNA polymerase sigma-70 factor (ECF subfamily)
MPTTPSAPTPTRLVAAAPAARGVRAPEVVDAAPAPVPAEDRDTALLLAHRHGDGSALGELLTRHQDRLYAICRRMIDDPDLASDMVQSAMVRIIHALDRFDGRSLLSTWMIRITMNVCLTELRRRKLRRAASLDALSGWGGGGGGGSESGSEHLWSPVASSEPGAQPRVELREDSARLAAAMGRVSPDQRAILLMRDVHHLDYQHIAEALEIPLGTVKSRLFRARAALRGEFERLEGGA